MVDEKHKNISHDLLGIQYLDDDCLLHIFSFLPIIDRVKVQRVSQRWKILSHMSWQSLKTFSIRQDFWGISDKNNIQIDRNILKQILKLCGKFITHIDLSNEDEYHGSNSKIRILPCKAIFRIVREMCPNVRSINIDRPCTESTVEYLATYFNKLTHFAIRDVNKEYEDYLSTLFSNNQNIKHLSMKNCFLTNKCLLHLNFEVMEVLSLDDCSVGMSQNLLTALKQFKKLCSLKFVRCRSEQNLWINPILSTVNSNLEKLKKLDIYFYNCSFECIELSCIDQLKNLETLYIGGNIMVTDEILTVIGDNCQKLINIKIYNSDCVTDTGFLYIASLPNLQYLSISSVEMLTDKYFEIMSKLTTLECSRCPNITNHGISKLILSSDSLKMLRINCCAKISTSDFSNDVVASRSDKLLVEIDSSEIDDNFVLNHFSISKYRDCTVRKIKKSCYDCFRAVNTHKSCVYCCDIKEAL